MIPSWSEALCLSLLFGCLKWAFSFPSLLSDLLVPKFCCSVALSSGLFLWFALAFKLRPAWLLSETTVWLLIPFRGRVEASFLWRPPGWSLLLPDFFVEGGRGIKDLVDLTPEEYVDAVDEGDDESLLGDNDILSASLLFTTDWVLGGLFGVSEVWLLTAWPVFAAWVTVDEGTTGSEADLLWWSLELRACWTLPKFVVVLYEVIGAGVFSIPCCSGSPINVEPAVV